MFDNFWNRLNRLFHGRYGFDRLSLFLFLISLVLLTNWYSFIPGILALSFALYRAFSKNYSRRYQELEYFDRLMNWLADIIRRMSAGLAAWWRKMKNKFNNWKTRFSQRKTHVFLKCPSCGNTLRLPKGKGKLLVTCPVCRHEFFKKT